MKCPFDPDYVTTWTNRDPVYQKIETENEDGTPHFLHMTNNDSSALTLHRFRDCLLDGCAAWDKARGRCGRAFA